MNVKKKFLPGLCSCLHSCKSIPHNQSFGHQPSPPGRNWGHFLTHRILVSIRPDECPIPILQVILRLGNQWINDQMNNEAHLVCSSVCISTGQFVGPFPVLSVFQKLSLRIGDMGWGGTS